MRSVDLSMSKIFSKLVKPVLLTLSAGVCVSLVGCSIFRPYKIPIQQGEYYSQKTMQQLKPNMTKEQILYLLGKPNASTPFEKNKWIYVYLNERDYLPRSESKMILGFKNNKLSSIDGDAFPPVKLTYTTVVAK